MNQSLKRIVDNKADGNLTVGQLLYFLKKNFNRDDKMCYMDYTPGVKDDCTYITNDQIGNIFFYRVSDMKDRLRRAGMSDESFHEYFPHENDIELIIH